MTRKTGKDASAGGSSGAEKRQSQPGRPGLLPPIGVDFDTALDALLKTPPPPKAEKPTRKKAAKKR
jgi:hypothetical protein